MKVRDLYKNYKGYSIMLFGEPLLIESIPFTHLPKNKDIDDCEVIDYKVTNKEHDTQSFDLNLKHKESNNIKGYIKAYIK